MRNLTPNATTFMAPTGATATVAPTDKPLFRTESRREAEPLHIFGVKIPVTDIEMGDVQLPSGQEPMLLPLPTAQFLAAQRKMPRHAFVPMNACRDQKGQITGFRALARVVDAPKPISTDAPTAREAITRLNVHVPHEAKFMLSGRPQKTPDLLLPSAIGADSTVGRMEQSTRETGESIEVAKDVTVPVLDVTYGPVQQIPSPKPGRGFILSRPAILAAGGRGDMFALDTVIKDGEPVGAAGLHRIN